MVIIGSNGTAVKSSTRFLPFYRCLVALSKDSVTAQCSLKKRNIWVNEADCFGWTAVTFLGVIVFWSLHLVLQVLGEVSQRLRISFLPVVFVQFGFPGSYIKLSGEAHVGKCGTRSGSHHCTCGHLCNAKIMALSSGTGVILRSA